MTHIAYNLVDADQPNVSDVALADRSNDLQQRPDNILRQTMEILSPGQLIRTIIDSTIVKLFDWLGSHAPSVWQFFEIRYFLFHREQRVLRQVNKWFEFYNQERLHALEIKGWGYTNLMAIDETMFEQIRSRFKPAIAEKIILQRLNGLPPTSYKKLLPMAAAIQTYSNNNHNGDVHTEFGLSLDLLNVLPTI